MSKIDYDLLFISEILEKYKCIFNSTKIIIISKQNCWTNKIVEVSEYLKLCFLYKLAKKFGAQIIT